MPKNKENTARIRKQIIENHMDEIEELVLRDKESLRSWLESTLALENKSKNQLIKEYSSYILEDEDI